MDCDLLLVAARNINRRYAVQTLKRRLNLVLGDGLQRGQIVATQRHRNDRHGVNINRHNGRVGCVIRQLALYLCNLVAQVGHCLIHIGIIRKPDDQHSHILGRGGLERIQTGQTRYRTLEFFGYLLLDILRTGTRVSSVNNRCRNLHGRHERQRQVLEAVKTKHNDQYVQQDGHYMVFDKGLCEFHARLALPAVCGVRGNDMHGCTV